MDVVGRVKDIAEQISVEMAARKDKLAADAKDAIRRLSTCVKDLVDRAERGTLTKVDEDLDSLAADVTRKMGRIALGNEEATRAKKMLGGFQEEVLSIRSAKAETEPLNPRIMEENAELKEENTQLEKDLAFAYKGREAAVEQLAEVQKDLDSMLAGDPPDTPATEQPPKTPAKPAAKKPTPDSGSGGGVASPAGEGTKTPEQEAEEQAGKKGDAKK